MGSRFLNELKRQLLRHVTLPRQAAETLRLRTSVRNTVPCLLLAAALCGFSDAQSQTDPAQQCQANGGASYCVRADARFFPTDGPQMGQMFLTGTEACVAALQSDSQRASLRNPEFGVQQNIPGCWYDYYENGVTFSSRMFIVSWIGVQQTCPPVGQEFPVEHSESEMQGVDKHAAF